MDGTNLLSVQARNCEWCRCRNNRETKPPKRQEVGMSDLNLRRTIFVYEGARLARGGSDE